MCPQNENVYYFTSVLGKGMFITCLLMQMSSWKVLSLPLVWK